MRPRPSWNRHRRDAGTDTEPSVCARIVEQAIGHGLIGAGSLHDTTHRKPAPTRTGMPCARWRKRRWALWPIWMPPLRKTESAPTRHCRRHALAMVNCTPARPQGDMARKDKPTGFSGLDHCAVGRQHASSPTIRVTRYPARLRALSRPARPHAQPVRHHRGSTSLDAGYFASPSGTAQHRRGIGWRLPKPGEGWLTKRNISASGQRTAPPPDPPDAARPRPRSIRLSGIRLVSGPMPAAPSRRNARKAPTDSTRGPPATRGRTTRNGWTLRRQ